MNNILLPFLLVGIPAAVIGLALAIVLWRRVMLHKSLDASKGFVSSPPLEDCVGRSGQALTVLRPGGIVMVDRRRLDARAQSEFIEKGKAITVIGVDGAQLVVDDIEPIELNTASK